MKLVMTPLAGAQPFPGGQGVLVDLQTSVGAVQLRLTNEDAEKLIAALQTLLPQKPQETRIPRSELAAIARFLEQASKRFEAGAEMRQ